MPPSAVARRKVASCRVGEQEATTTRSRPLARMSSLISSWPGSEHMYLYARATLTPGRPSA